MLSNVWDSVGCCLVVVNPHRIRAVLARGNPTKNPLADFLFCLIRSRLAMLFNVLDIVDPARYEVYLLLVQFSGKTRITPSLTTQLEQQVRQ